MSAITITISPTRTLVADGRLVAGESADISVVGGVPAALYLVGEDREVVAACTSFVPGESSATGVLNLATDKIAAIVADMAAGAAAPLSCLVEDASGAVVGYGFVQLVAAPMPDELEHIDVDLYLKASDIRALFADVPTSYANQRSLSAALSQVVTILKTLGLSALVAFMAMATEWQDVPANTVIGEGLTLTNGTISAAGGGTDGRAVTNIVNGIVADKTLMANADGVVTNRSTVKVSNLDVSNQVHIGGGMMFYHPGGTEDFVANDEVARQGDLAPYAKTADLGTAAYRDANEFATAADEALVYQLLTNRLSGVTFDFATVAGLYLAISNIVAAQGGAITNFPAIP